MPDVAEILATPERFLAWLTEDRARVVGLRAVNESCPIAGFLRDVAGVSFPNVSPISISWYVRWHDPDTATLDTPEWAQRFLLAVDAPVDLAHWTGRGYEEEVIAQEAIFILLENES